MDLLVKHHRKVLHVIIVCHFEPLWQKLSYSFLVYAYVRAFQNKLQLRVDLFANVHWELLQSLLFDDGQIVVQDLPLAP